MRTAGHGAFALPRPAGSAAFLTEGRQQRPHPLWGDAIHHSAPGGSRGDLRDPKERFQGAATAALLHCTLKLAETGVLKEQHGKATQQRVVQARGTAIGLPEVGDVPEGVRPEGNHGRQGHTLSGAHPWSLLQVPCVAGRTPVSRNAWENSEGERAKTPSA